MRYRHQTETKADHLAIFNMCMQRHADAHIEASAKMHDPQVANCYQGIAACWYSRANYHRACWYIAPTERSGWRPY